MEALSAFKFPGESRALHPLSPERVNAGRMASNTTTATTTSSKESMRGDNDSQLEAGFRSPQSSPSRRSKNNLLLLDCDFLSSPSNKTTGGFALPQSPSLPEFNALQRGHARTNSDVQGLVKRFEHLDVRDRDAETADRRKRHEAELRRAQIAREEAESDVKRLREEVRRYKKERDDGLDRQRTLAKRIEIVSEEFTAFKESNSSQSSLYEKEIRKARKEAFKSSSAVLKMQEESKGLRANLRVIQQNFEQEKHMLKRKEQERFEMEYQLIPLQEQVEKLSQQLKVADEEREMLKRNLKEEELARAASEGMIALPASSEQDDGLQSPGKSPRKPAQSPLSDDKENKLPLQKSSEIRQLMEQLQREKGLRRSAEDLADFLRLECMFRCCTCKTASRLSRDFALRLDGELAQRVEKVQTDMAECMSVVCGVSDDVPDESPADAMEVETERGVVDSPIATDEVIELKAESVLEQRMHEAEEEEGSVLKMDGSVPDTFNTENEAHDDPDSQLLREQTEHSVIQLNRSAPDEQFIEPESRERTPAAEVKVPLRPETPPQHSQGTPFRQQPSIRTVTTTTTIPMHFTPVAKPSLHFADVEAPGNESENIPPPASAPLKSTNQSESAGGSAVTPAFDRAAALAAIEERRGRARSFAAGHATPRKQMIEGVRDRRDISAPALGQKVAAANTAPQQTGSAIKRSGSATRPRR